MTSTVAPAFQQVRLPVEFIQHTLSPSPSPPSQLFTSSAAAALLPAIPVVRAYSTPDTNGIERERHERDEEKEKERSEDSSNQSTPEKQLLLNHPNQNESSNMYATQTTTTTTTTTAMNSVVAPLPPLHDAFGQAAATATPSTMTSSNSISVSMAQRDWAALLFKYRSATETGGGTIVPTTPVTTVAAAAHTSSNPQQHHAETATSGVGRSSRATTSTRASHPSTPSNGNGNGNGASHESPPPPAAATTPTLGLNHRAPTLPTAALPTGQRTPQRPRSRSYHLHVATTAAAGATNPNHAALSSYAGSTPVALPVASVPQPSHPATTATAASPSLNVESVDGGDADTHEWSFQDKQAMQNELSRLRALLAMQSLTISQQQQQQLQLPAVAAPTAATVPIAPSPSPPLAVGSPSLPSGGAGLSWNTAFAALSHTIIPTQQTQQTTATIATSATTAAVTPSSTHLSFRALPPSPSVSDFPSSLPMNRALTSPGHGQTAYGTNSNSSALLSYPVPIQLPPAATQCQYASSAIAPSASASASGSAASASNSSALSPDYRSSYRTLSSSIRSGAHTNAFPSANGAVIATTSTTTAASSTASSNSSHAQSPSVSLPFAAAATTPTDTTSNRPVSVVSNGNNSSATNQSDSLAFTPLPQLPSIPPPDALLRTPSLTEEASFLPPSSLPPAIPLPHPHPRVPVTAPVNLLLHPTVANSAHSAHSIPALPFPSAMHSTHSAAAAEIEEELHASEHSQPVSHSLGSHKQYPPTHQQRADSDDPSQQQQSKQQQQQQQTQQQQSQLKKQKRPASAVGRRGPVKAVHRPATAATSQPVQLKGQLKLKPRPVTATAAASTPNRKPSVNNVSFSSSTKLPRDHTLSSSSLSSSTPIRRSSSTPLAPHSTSSTSRYSRESIESQLENERAQAFTFQPQLISKPLVAWEQTTMIERVEIWQKRHQMNEARKIAQKKAYEEEQLAECTFHPNLSATAGRSSAAASSSVIDSEISPSARIDRLYHEADHRFALREKARRLVEEEKMAHFTFQPTITTKIPRTSRRDPNKQKESEVSVLSAAAHTASESNKPLYQRIASLQRQKNEELHRLLLKSREQSQEAAELTFQPKINEVSERLAKEKEEREKKRRTQQAIEQHLASTSPQTSALHDPALVERIPSPPRNVVERLSDQRSAQKIETVNKMAAEILQKQQQKGQSPPSSTSGVPPASSTCGLFLNRVSAELITHSRYFQGPNLDFLTRQERMAEEIRQQQEEKRRNWREYYAEQGGVNEYTFKPDIGNAKRILEKAKEREERFAKFRQPQRELNFSSNSVKEAERCITPAQIYEQDDSAPAPSPLPFQPSPTARRVAHNTQQQLQQKLLSGCTFKPEISAVSRTLAENKLKQQSALGGPLIEQELKQITQEILQQQRVKQFQQSHPFQPQLNPISQTMIKEGLVTPHYSSKDVQATTQSIQQAAERKELKRLEYERAKQVKELEECTFKPTLSTNTAAAGASKENKHPNSSGSSSAPIPIRGLNRFLELKNLAVRKQLDKQQRERKIFLIDAMNKHADERALYTIPQPFTLSNSNANIHHQHQAPTSGYQFSFEPQTNHSHMKQQLAQVLDQE